MLGHKVLPHIPATGLIAAGAVLALLASTPGSPLVSTITELGDISRPLEPVGDFLGIGRLGARAISNLTIATLLAAVIFFLTASRQAWRGALSLRRVIVVAVILHAMTAVMPTVFSEDVYSYTMYGRIVSEHGGNPYVDVPEDFSEDPLAVRVGFRDKPTVYGPVFTTLAAAITAVTPHVPAAVLSFALLSMVASLATMGLAVAAAGILAPARMAFAGVVIGWNPVMVFHTVGGAHNDTLVAASIAAAVLLMLKQRTLLAIAVLVLGTLIKVIVALALVIAFAYVIAVGRPGERLKHFLKHAGIGALVALPFVIPFFTLSNPTFGALQSTRNIGSGSGFVETIMTRVGLGGLSEIAAKSAQALAPALTVIATGAIVLLLLRKREIPRVGASIAGIGWIYLLAALAIDLHFPWYGAWILPTAWALPASGRVAVLITTGGLSILHPWLGLDISGPFVIGAFYIGLSAIVSTLAWVCIALFRIIKRGLSEGSAALLDPSV